MFSGKSPYCSSSVPYNLFNLKFFFCSFFNTGKFLSTFSSPLRKKCLSFQNSCYSDVRDIYLFIFNLPTLGSLEWKDGKMSIFSQLVPMCFSNVEFCAALILLQWTAGSKVCVIADDQRKGQGTNNTELQQFFFNFILPQPCQGL